MNPRWLYHPTEDPRIFDDWEPMLNDGWFTDPREARPEKKVESTEDDIDELRAQAGEKGIKVDKRWGIARLLSAIKERDD